MTMAQRSTAVCTFDSRAQAERAVEELRRAGFREDEIGFAMRGAEGRTTAEPEGTHGAEAAATGALAGAGVGGVLGALAAGLIPGVGPVIAGGLLAGIAGGAILGAGAGGLVGWLAGEGVPEDEARYYDSEFQAGRAIVTVKSEGRYNEAATILSRYGRCEAPSVAAMTGTERRAAVDTTASDRTTRVPVREEEVVAGTRTVSAGEVEVRKEVRTEQQHFTVPVEREEVRVERHPVNRPSDTPVGQDDQTIRVPLMREEVEVTKRPVVREEVEISRERVREEVPVNETVRREEVYVEMEDWKEVGPRFRQDWERRYGSTAGRWADYEPGYRYGYEMAHDPRFRGRNWSDVEADMRTGYSSWAGRYGYRSEPNMWERIKDGVRNAWEDARNTTGRRR